MSNDGKPSQYSRDDLIKEIKLDEEIKEYYRGHSLRFDDYINMLVEAVKINDLDEIAHARDKLNHIYFIVLRHKYLANVDR